ncbi:hypothetical protein DAPPUDRAFT_273715 [Daphnia pulex]|uniref:Uncharacterized protein n=1 Tax=Daphnia pulex TaxID=6669 RepID=E9I3N4_DAPPU|nr:hypothetical protein DAPPUDRAFT_273715 [Daphnia pulex]|eukprot:EFX61396.1 hypothetical protein DAPPUDRAFT_273715 [Daphnia pulex]
MTDNAHMWVEKSSQFQILSKFLNVKPEDSSIASLYFQIDYVREKEDEFEEEEDENGKERDFNIELIFKRVKMERKKKNTEKK